MSHLEPRKVKHPINNLRNEPTENYVLIKPTVSSNIKARHVNLTILTATEVIVHS